MIFRIHELDGKDLPESDVCVVGSGAAGTEIASQLARASLSVTLLESGLDAFDFETQRLCRFESVGRPMRAPSYDEPFDLATAAASQSRLRQYGGTTNIWAGRWKVLTPIDFLPKAMIGHPGWPIGYDDVVPFYVDVARDYGLSDLLAWNAPGADGPFEISAAPGFSPSVHIINDAPLNVRTRFDAELRQAPRVAVVLGANVVDVRLGESLTAVESLRVRSLDGREWTARARSFVLACGAIENAKILLQSRSQVPAGVGNGHDLVGRNLLDHPKGALGRLIIPRSRPVPTETSETRGPDRKYGLGITLAASTLVETSLPNHCVHLKTTRESGKYILKINLEQLPNRDSRVSLSAERDPLGMPLARVDWRFRQADSVALERFTAILRARLAPHGDPRIDDERFSLDFVTDASHHLGTTAMAASPADGVVDSDCRVFGLDNLFVAGSSVFPTGGNANPTFTILALARRLAGHLAGRAAFHPGLR